VDPDTVDRAVAPTEQSTFRGALERFMPEANGDLLSLAACLYTSTPDGHFIIDRHPEHPRLIVAAGFSGHGFKFASVVGEILADLVLDEGTRHPIGFLSAGRFGKRGTKARRHEGTK
jgi:sarcosine oxidase